MNRSTDGTLRRPFAAATATIRRTNPIGNNQSRLNHRSRPTRTRGAMPCTWGIEPAHVVGSTTSSPLRQLRSEAPHRLRRDLRPCQRSALRHSGGSRPSAIRQRDRRCPSPTHVSERGGKGGARKASSVRPVWAFVGHSATLHHPGRRQAILPRTRPGPSSVWRTPSPSTAKSMRSDSPWRCGGRVWPGLSRMSRTLDCEPSMSGFATSRSLSYPGASLNLVISITPASRSPTRARASPHPAHPHRTTGNKTLWVWWNRRSVCNTEARPDLLR